MAVAHDPITALIRHVDARGSTVTGRRLANRWTQRQPSLTGWSTAGEIAAACRSATGADQDRILDTLLQVAAGDELAQLTVVAGLSGRLETVAAGWARSGASCWELPGLGADLIAACWETTGKLAEDIEGGRPMPVRVAWHLVDEAREAIRVPRRVERRAAARQDPIERRPIPTTGTPVEEQLATEIAGAVRDGRITRLAAAPVFLTRVAGFDVTEAAERLGCTPAALRAVRSRAERRLAAA